MMTSKKQVALQHPQQVRKIKLLTVDLDEFDDKELHDFDADAMVDPAEVVDKEGDIVDCFHS